MRKVPCNVLLKYWFANNYKMPFLQLSIEDMQISEEVIYEPQECHSYQRQITAKKSFDVENYFQWCLLLSYLFTKKNVFSSLTVSFVR